MTTIRPAAADDDNDRGVGGTAAAATSGMTSESFYLPTVSSIGMASAVTQYRREMEMVGARNSYFSDALVGAAANARGGFNPNNLLWYG